MSLGGARMARTNDTTYLPGLAELMEGRIAIYVAEQLDIDQSTLSLLISCKRGASLAMARKIAAYFGVSIERLLADKVVQGAK